MNDSMVVIIWALLSSVVVVVVFGSFIVEFCVTGLCQIALPTESATGTSYLQHYCEYIKAIESKCSGKKRLPLCIMVSADNKDRTVKFLQDNRCFGLKSRQITIVQQGDGVPALADNDAKIVIDDNDPFRVVTKPHGHGDIHALLHAKGITKEWEENLGIKWMVIFQVRFGIMNMISQPPPPPSLSIEHSFNLLLLCFATLFAEFCHDYRTRTDSHSILSRL